MFTHPRIFPFSFFLFSKNMFYTTKNNIYRWICLVMALSARDIVMEETQLFFCCRLVWVPPRPCLSRDSENGYFFFFSPSRYIFALYSLAWEGAKSHESKKARYSSLSQFYRFARKKQNGTELIM
jgi:hypothetical protein